MQAQQFIDVENSDIWEYSSIDIDETGRVTGYAYTYEFGDGYDVGISVSSYEFERDGRTKMNHVPIVNVTEAHDGRIVKQIKAHDSLRASKAIENAVGAAKIVFKRPDQFDL
jgi:hypothetical protein